jgi:predicted double-glycine peptidase
LHVGETACVRGQVVSTYKSGNVFFIDFDFSRTSFYSVSFEHAWDGLKRQCVEISGKIADNRGRPQIVIEKREQLNFCR